MLKKLLRWILHPSFGKLELHPARLQDLYKHNPDTHGEKPWE